MTDDGRQFPLSGQLFFCRQLQFFFGFRVVFVV